MVSGTTPKRVAEGFCELLKYKKLAKLRRQAYAGKGNNDSTRAYNWRVKWVCEV